MKVVVLILLLNYASAEAEAKAEADPKHRSGHSGQVKKPVVKIANLPIIKRKSLSILMYLYVPQIIK